MGSGGEATSPPHRLQAKVRGAGWRACQLTGSDSRVRFVLLAAWRDAGVVVLEVGSPGTSRLCCASSAKTHHPSEPQCHPLSVKIMVPACEDSCAMVTMGCHPDVPSRKAYLPQRLGVLPSTESRSHQPLNERPRVQTFIPHGDI